MFFLFSLFFLSSLLFFLFSLSFSLLFFFSAALWVPPGLGRTAAGPQLVIHLVAGAADAATPAGIELLGEAGDTPPGGPNQHTSLGVFA